MVTYVYIETYGCVANQNNSEILSGLLKQSSYEITNNINLAEIIIINSCVVKGKTKTKIFRRIQDLAEKYGDKLMIISGCMPETDFKQIKKLNPRALFLGTHHFKDIVKLIKNFRENQLTSKKQKQYLSEQEEEKINLPKLSKSKIISITQISEGCTGKCTYCLTRQAKGKLFSYSQEKILKSIENDLQQGAKEIWITSQDNASYGLDNGKHELPKLLKKILSLKHRFKLRLGMMNPNNLYPILDEMIEIYKNPKMYKFLHIPIQSASDKVLKDMKRHYKIKQVKEIIIKFKKEFLDITISIDIIIGYPAETKQDFQESLNFVRKFKPDVFNLSKFSLHKSTGAEKLNELPISTINNRTTEIMKLHRETALENKKRFLNKEINVFVNKKSQGFFEARDENYNIILIKSNDKSLLGKNVNIKIIQIGVHHMMGEIM